MKQGDLRELEITDLSHTGDGVGRIDSYVVFVPDTVTGDRILARIIKVKKQYAQGKLRELIEPSPHRTRPHCIVADKCGGCQWQHITPEYQLKIKSDQVRENLQRIGGFAKPEIFPILASRENLGYRNKVTYPLGKSATGKIQTGYYQRNSHEIVNINQCPVQDPRLNPILAEIKEDIQQRGWTIYDENSHQGQLRHLSLRIGRFTGEILLTLVTNDWNLTGIKEQAQIWLQRYPDLVGVALNYNQERTNVIFGEQTRTIAGKPYLREIFGGLEFHLRPETFFQINTETAQALLEVILQRLQLQGRETLIDAYCGIGTFTLPLAQRVKEAIGIEVQPTAIIQAKHNAEINQIRNVTFHTGTVETILGKLNLKPDLVLLDPPRKGCEEAVLETLMKLKPAKIVYISCQSATLARDLKWLCAKGNYSLDLVQPADFFPYTSHIECAAFLTMQT